MFFPGNISGGVGSVVMNIFRNIDKDGFSIDFCVPDSDSGEYNNEIKRGGGQVFSIPHIRTTGPFKFIKTLEEILVKNGPYDAVHIHSVHMGVLALIAAKKAGIKKRIYHVHNTRDEALSHIPFHKTFERLLNCCILKNATIYLACGQNAGKYIYGRRPFVVINNAIDPKRFYPYGILVYQKIKEELSINIPQKYVVGNIARFSKVKNQIRLVDIARLDRERKDLFVFLLVGEGETLSEVKEYAKKNKCDDKVIFAGMRTDTEKMYNAMDVFCLPSFFEGLPVTMIEAQACGLPCLVSDAVTAESDLKISKVEYLSLLDTNQKWLETMYDLVDKKVNDRLYIQDILVQKGYELESMINQIENIYLK